MKMGGVTLRMGKKEKLVKKQNEDKRGFLLGERGIQGPAFSSPLLGYRKERKLAYSSSSGF